MIEVELQSALVFVLGLIAGSFANAVIFRHNTGERIGLSRSRCFHCGKELLWRELIPIFSFLFQGGRCRSCGSKISWQYPLVEFLLGILFLLAWLKWRQEGAENFFLLGSWLLVLWILVVLAVYDLRHKILPDFFSYAFIILSVLILLAFRPTDLFSLLLALAPAGFLFLIFFFSQGRLMGLGDAKVMAGAGLFLGSTGGLEAFLWAFWIGALWGVGLLFLKTNFTLKSELPFGPFLVLGIILAFFYPGFLSPLFIFV